MSKIIKKLSCGIEYESLKNKNQEYIILSFEDIYKIDGEEDSFMLLSEVFKELQELGYKNDGINYDRDDNILELYASRRIFK